jgi:hypothetical protein
MEVVPVVVEEALKAETVSTTAIIITKISTSSTNNNNLRAAAWVTSSSTRGSSKINTKTVGITTIINITITITTLREAAMVPLTPPVTIQSKAEAATTPATGDRAPITLSIIAST